MNPESYAYGSEFFFDPNGSELFFDLRLESAGVGEGPVQAPLHEQISTAGPKFYQITS